MSHFKFGPIEYVVTKYKNISIPYILIEDLLNSYNMNFVIIKKRLILMLEFLRQFFMI